MTSTPQTGPYFDRRTTQLIKGIALILMFIHHFFTFPEALIASVSYPWMEGFAALFREPTKICVSLFAFLTGYFYFFQESKTFRYSLKKIGDLLIPYWAVFLILLLVRALIEGEFVLQKAVLEFFVLRYSVMIFCWYVQFYCLTMLLLPVLTRFMPRESKFLSFVLGAGVPYVLLGIGSLNTDVFLLQSALSSLQQWLPCVVSGYLFAQHDLFRSWLDKIFTVSPNKWVQRAVWLCLAAAVFFGRRVLDTFIPASVLYAGDTMHLYLTMDMVYAPCFIYALVRLTESLPRRVRAVPEAIGTRSMVMWFLHCIFFNGSDRIFQPILYFPRNPILVLIWGLALCYGAAVIIDWICRPLIRGKNKLLNV